MPRRERSIQLRLASLLAACLAIFGLAYFFQAAETPPWESATPAATSAEKPAIRRTTPPQGEIAPFRFMAYNVRNWLNSRQGPPKSADSKAAVIEIIISGKPDILGLSEIGRRSDAVEIQGMLALRGLNLPHIHYSGGPDPVRHLALLSKFPISSIEQPDPKIADSDFSIQRGILDVTCTIGDSSVRFIGLHLKSKRTVPKIDEALLRLKEAEQVRLYLDSIFHKNSQPRIIMYGDFNDHIRSSSTKILLGTRRRPDFLYPVKLEDSRGETWTHRFGKWDNYSRIDFITVSKSMKRHLVKSSGRIIDQPAWEAASDHRAIFVDFR